MPNVLRVEGFIVKVLLPPREHGPAHVHVVKGGAEIVIGLDPVELRKIKGNVTDAEIRAALRIVVQHRQDLLIAWRKIHG